MSRFSSPISGIGNIESQAAPIYAYQSLPDINHIRRVIIHPESLQQPIIISLDTVPFLQNQYPQYEALSYTWGSEENREIIRVDSADGQAISVTSNLAVALKYLRHTDKPRTMWIDAICINQADVVEKGPQVKMMGEIYRHAARVAVWLGPEADNSDIAMAKMEYLGSQIQFDFAKTMRMSPAMGAMELDMADWKIPLHLESKDLHAITHLLRRSCFLRSAHIHASLFALRDTFGTSGCADPRDRIYGVLALLPDFLGKKIVPDYTKPFGDVYKETFLHCLRTTMDLSVLRESWYEIPTPNLLRVAGVSIGAIQHLDGVQAHSSNRREILEELRRLIINIIYPERKIIDDDEIEFVARTLVCNMLSDGTEPPDERLPTVEAGKRVIRKMLSDVDEFNQLDEEELDFLRPFEHMPGKQIFKTADGQLGVAKAGAQLGDQICVLIGCDAPLVLRPTLQGKFLVIYEG
ncbi:nkyrin and het domain protein [Diaporthe amygdali]|uniref:nkyrin and het domain protein n=1 Tax=Phomopsis amygdali TaxID=1214568 RepID=UPI0022FF0449|nr:nkyrin and het domain protein [Diaporthe amygdali]KAJ0116171.1 nkyrin and het domain protein [Diaporthe amygdali]